MSMSNETSTCLTLVLYFSRRRILYWHWVRRWANAGFR